MAQDGTSIEREIQEKLGRLGSEKASWQRYKDEQEAKVRRMHSLEQATSIVKTGIDWSDTDDSRRAGQIALELADKFSRWVEAGQLPAA